MAEKLDLDKVQKENEKTRRDMKNLLAEIKSSFNKEEALYKELGISREEIAKSKMSVGDLPPEQRKIYDMFVKEFVAEKSARKAKEGSTLSKTLQKSKTGSIISRKGIRI